MFPMIIKIIVVIVSVFIIHGYLSPLLIGLAYPLGLLVVILLYLAVLFYVFDFQKLL